MLLTLGLCQFLYVFSGWGPLADTFEVTDLGLLLLTVGYPSIIYLAKNHSLAKYLSKMFFTTLLLVIARLSCAFFSWYDNHFSAFVFQQTSMLLRSQLVLHKTFQVSVNLTLYLVFYWHHNIIWMTITYSLWFVLCFHVKPH